MTVFKELAAEHEAQRKAPKTEDYYREILKPLSVNTLQGIKKLTALIQDQIEIDAPWDLYEPPYVIGISKERLEQEELTISDAASYLEAMVRDRYMAVPPAPKGGFSDRSKYASLLSDDEAMRLPPREKYYDSDTGTLRLYAPINAWSAARQDDCFDYPYQENFEGFHAALKNVLAPLKQLDKKKEAGVEKLMITPGSDLIGALQNQHQSITNLTASWDFFVGVAEYVKTVKELTQTQPIIGALEQQRKVAQLVNKQLDMAAFQEMREAAEKMQKFVQSMAKQYEPITNAMKEVQDMLNGLTWVSSPLQQLDHSLFDVARAVRESGNAQLISEFENNDKKPKNIHGDYTFSPSYERLADEEVRLEQVSAREPWGTWEKLSELERIVLEPEDLINEVKTAIDKKPERTMQLLGLKGVISELEALRTGKISDEDAVFFLVQPVKGDFSRFHRHLIAELLKSGGVDVNLKTTQEPMRTLEGLPNGIRWEKVAIKIEDDEHTSIEILYDGRTVTSRDYEALGFANKRRDSGNLSWRFMGLLAIIHSTKNPEKATAEELRHALGEKDRPLSLSYIHRVKSNLSKDLRELFGTNEEPFHDYKDTGYYLPKFKLLPSPIMRQEEPFPQGGRLREDLI